MFSEFIENLADQYAKNLPFVVYRKPKENTVHAIFQKDALIHEVIDFTEIGFVFAPFDAEEKRILLPLDRTDQVIYAQNIPLNREGNSVVQTDVSQKDFYINLVEKGITRIHQGAFEKIVLSRKIEEETSATPLQLFENLLFSYSTAFCYLWHHPKIGTWLGATPEILLETNNRKLTTMSLAGTQKYTGTDTIVWQKKELKEQELVTKYIEQKLVEMVADLKISERESVRAGNLWHLRTKLMGSVDGANLVNIVKVLHPTPAVCGLPMEATKNFILKNEGYHRAYYTGYLGELNFKSEKNRSSRKSNQENQVYKTLSTNTTLFVNLRCMQILENKAHIYVGGGVTRDSDPEKEWQETVAKCQTMLRVLGSS